MTMLNGFINVNIYCDEKGFDAKTVISVARRYNVSMVKFGQVYYIKETSIDQAILKSLTQKLEIKQKRSEQLKKIFEYINEVKNKNNGTLPTNLDEEEENLDTNNA